MCKNGGKNMAEIDWHRVEELKTKCSVCGRNLKVGFRWFWPYPEAAQNILVETFCGAGCKISKFGFMKEADKVDIWHYTGMEEARKIITKLGMRMPE